jgi:hypothetical protein
MIGHANVHVILFSIVLVVTVFSNVHLALVEQEQSSLWSYPRLDAINFKVIKGADARGDAIIDGIVDVIPGPETSTRINRVEVWGANLSWAPSAVYRFITLQCRDVWPPEAAAGPEGKIPGQTCSPMNYSGFRVALSYIFGMDDKNATIFNYVQGPQTYAIQSIIPPAQAYWYDPTVKLPVTNFTAAWALMQADGFHVSDGILYDSNDVPCRDLRIYYAGGTSWQMEIPDLVDAFNDFMDNYLGVTNCNLNFNSKDFVTLIYGDLMLYHDFDMICIGLTGLGPDPGWLVSNFYSIDEGVWNFAGVNDPYIDHLMDIIRYSIDPNEIKQACYDFQHYFNGEMPESAIAFGATGKGSMPHFLWSSGMVIESYHPDLEGFVSTPCYGSLQSWTYSNLHWKDQPVGGTARIALADEPTNINPFYENTPYGWQLLNGLCEPLVQYNPINLDVMPWLAKDYYYEGLINATTPSGKTVLNGMRIDYYIREGVYWQDSGAYKDVNGNGVHDVGEPQYEFPFTAYDCKFAADMLMKYKPGRYDAIWTNMVEVSTEGPYKFTVWYNNTSSYWYANRPSMLSYFPQHIYQKADIEVGNGTLALFSDFKPYTVKYTDWNGLHPPDEWGPPPTQTGWWSALIGTGPYIFGYYSPSTLLGQIVKNTRYWAGQFSILQSLETCNEINDINYFKKEPTGPTITIENTTTINPSSPEFSYWHETDPTPINDWHIDGWKDINSDGLFSVGDEVTLSKDLAGNGQWQGQGEFQVESLTWNDGSKRWIMQVKEVQYTPKLTQTSIVIDIRNLVWERPATRTLNIDVYYEVFCYANKIASGWIMDLSSFDEAVECVPIIGWSDIETSKHTFRVDFYVRQAGSAQDPEYACNVSRVFVYLPGDANNDGTVNYVDIYSYGVKNFLVDKTAYAWKNYHDETENNPGPRPPGKYADVNGDGIVNMADIYRMIIMFMKTVDP